MGDTTSCQKCGTELSGGSGEPHCEVCDPAPAAGFKVADKTLVVHANTKRPASSALPGVKDRFFGDYELIEEIAQGGMGVVYKARQISLNRIVALKMILWGQFATEADIKRFLSEAEAASNLDHPNIVPIFQVGEHDGRHYFSMRFIDGGGLDEQIGKYRDNLRLGVRLVSTVARAIHFAHQRGILHRDLKPANILLDSHGQPYVTDFGLAKRVTGDGNVTHADVIMGSPNYMSPEQAAGEKSRLTTATDIYSLGAILYLLLTGRAPFESDSPMETLKRLAEEEPRPPREWNSSVDRDLETICLKCLEKDPTRRYGSADALADDLEHWRKNEPIAARPVGAIGRSIKWAKRRPTAAALVAVLIGGAVALVVLQGLNNRRLIREINIADNERRVANTQTTLAERSAETNRLQLLRFDIGAAVRTMDEGDQTGSLLWLAQALSLERRPEKSPGNSANENPILDRDENDRIRLQAILQTCPRLESFSTMNGMFLSHNVTSPDGGWVAEFSPKGGRLPEGPPPMGRPGDGGFGKGKKGRQSSYGRAGKPKGEIGPVDVRLWNTRQGKSESLTMSVGFPIHHAALSPDGSLIATATGTNTVEVFELKTGEPVAQFKSLVHNGAVKSIVFSPAGNMILTTSAITESGPAEAQVWDAGSGAPITPSLLHSREVEFANFSPDGKQVLTASADKTARLWELPSGKMLQEFRHGDRVLHAAFSPGGDRIATASADRTVRVWDVASGRELGLPMIHNFPVIRVLFSPDGRRLITANNDNTTRVWDVSSSSGSEMVGLAVHHNARLVDVRFTPDASAYLTVTETMARLWDVGSGQPVSPPFLSHSEILHAALDADGRRLLVISADQTVWLWDISTPRSPPYLTLNHGGAVSTVAFSPNSRLVVTSGGEAKRKVWNVADGKAIDQLRDANDVSIASFGPDGTHVNLSSGAKLPDPRNEIHNPTRKLSFKPPHHKSESVARSGDGRRFATTEGENGRTVQVEDIFTGSVLATFRRPPGNLAELVFDASGNHLALVSTNEYGGGSPEAPGNPEAAIFVWDIGKNQLAGLPVRLTNSEVPLCAAVSPGGHRVVVGTDKNYAEILTVENQGPLRYRKKDRDSVAPIRLEHSGDVISVAFSPDGSRVATASADNTARVWNAATGEPTTPLLEHESRVVQVAFSGDGRRVLTASWDQTARVWDAQTGEAITPPLMNSSQVNSAIFSPDGNRVAAAGADGTVRLWNLPPSALKQEEVLMLARLLSGRRMDNEMSFIPASKEVLETAWEKLRTQLPQLTAPPESMAKWHERLASQGEAGKDWYAVRFHLDRLLLTKPGDSKLLARRDHAEEELEKLSPEQPDRNEVLGVPAKVP